MSASNEWTEYHLTPSGWISGTFQVDFAGVTQKPIPENRLLTCTYHELLSSSFSKKMHKDISESWRSPDAVAVESALKQYGACPNHL